MSTSYDKLQDADKQAVQEHWDSLCAKIAAVAEINMKSNDRRFSAVADDTFTGLLKSDNLVALAFSTPDSAHIELFEYCASQTGDDDEALALAAKAVIEHIDAAREKVDEGAKWLKSNMDGLPEEDAVLVASLVEKALSA